MDPFMSKLVSGTISLNTVHKLQNLIDITFHKNFKPHSLILLKTRQVREKHQAGLIIDKDDMFVDVHIQ